MSALSGFVVAEVADKLLLLTLDVLSIANWFFLSTSIVRVECS